MFGQNERPSFLALKQIEKTLCCVLYSKKIAIHLWYILHWKKNKNKTLSSLPPTSNMSHGHILRSHYFALICSNLISAPESYLNPVEFGWNSVDSLLMPNKYIVTLTEIYTVTCGCKKSCIGRWQCSKKFGASSTEFCKCNEEECYT